MTTRESLLRAIHAASFVSLLAVPGVLGAQRLATSLDLTGTSMRYQDSLSASGTSIAPALRTEWASGTLALSGVYSSRGSAGSTLDGFAGGSVFTPAWRMLLVEGATTLAGTRHETGFGSGQAMVVGRAHVMGAQQGIWVGVGRGQSWNGVVKSPVESWEASAWIQRGNLTALLTHAPTSFADTTRYSDLQLAARWSARQLELGAAVSRRSGLEGASVPVGQDIWGSVSATAWVASRLALVASLGSYPADQMLAHPGGTVGTLGIRLASHRNDALTDREATQADMLEGRTVSRPDGIASFTVVTTARGARVIRVHAPRARQVEITADFTQWRVVALSAAGNGWWTTTVQIPSGAHELEVRVDGGRWAVPPGLTPVRDEFGGMSGLLVVH